MERVSIQGIDSYRAVERSNLAYLYMHSSLESYSMVHRELGELNEVQKSTTIFDMASNNFWIPTPLSQYCDI